MSHFKKVKFTNKQWTPPMFKAPVSFTPPNTSQPPMFKVFWWGSAPRMEIVHRGSECTWSAGNFLRAWAPKRLDGNSFPEWTYSAHRFRVFCSSSTSTGTPKSGNLFRPCVRNNYRRNGLNFFANVQYISMFDKWALNVCHDLTVIPCWRHRSGSKKRK